MRNNIDNAKLARNQERFDQKMDLARGAFNRYREARENAEGLHSSISRSSLLQVDYPLEQFLDVPPQELAKVNVDATLVRRALDEYARAARLFQQYERIGAELKPMGALLRRLHAYAEGTA